MARAINRLSARGAATLKDPGMHADGAGLYLVIDMNGARRWTFIFQWRGKRKEMGLGSFQDVGLAEARESARDARKLVSQGQNPIEARKAKERGPQTFAMVAAAYIRAHRRGWKSRVHARQWVSTLRTYAKPLRSMAIEDVATADVLGVLTPIWNTVPETASRVRGRIEKVLDAAKAKELRQGENPARWRGHLDHLLPKRLTLSRGHHAALPYTELSTFMAKLRERPAIAARALEFTILTASRTNEALGARWSEIDLVADVWTVPPERMKAKRSHRIPLSARAIEILGEMQPLARDEGFIFPGPSGNAPLSNMSMSMLLRRMSVTQTVHGFRSSFRDWVGEATNFQSEVAEAALSHTVGDATERAYRRGDALAKRRDLMAAWATYCATPPTANVLQFKR